MPKTNVTKVNKPIEEQVAEDTIQEPEIVMDVDDNILEPETGQEPAGPDQSMPVSTEPNPPSERKATSYINVSDYILCEIN